MFLHVMCFVAYVFWSGISGPKACSCARPNNAKLVIKLAKAAGEQKLDADGVANWSALGILAGVAAAWLFGQAVMVLLASHYKSTYQQ